MENQKLLYSYSSHPFPSDFNKHRDKPRHQNPVSTIPSQHQLIQQAYHSHGSGFFQMGGGSQGVQQQQMSLQMNGQQVLQQYPPQQFLTQITGNSILQSQLKSGNGVIQGNLKEPKANISGIKNNYVGVDSLNTHCPAEIAQYLQAAKGIIEEGSFQERNTDKNQDQRNQGIAAGAVYNSINGTKSTTALGSMVNLSVGREASSNQAPNSQMMFVRGSMGNGITSNGQAVVGGVALNGVGNSVTIQNNSNSTRGTNNQANSQLQHNQQQFKSSKAQMYEKMVYQQDKKSFYMSGPNQAQQMSQNTQNGLFPRISNLRNEVTVLFKNSSNNQTGTIQSTTQQQLSNNPSNNSKVMALQLGNTTKAQIATSKPLSSPRLENRINTQENQGSKLFIERAAVTNGSQYYSANLMNSQP